MIVGIAFGGLAFFVTWISTTLDYQLNKAIIDAISAEDIQGYSFFTFSHFITWYFVNDPQSFYLYALLACIGIAVGFTIFLHLKYGKK
jgi:hypothetical protein